MSNKSAEKPWWNRPIWGEDGLIQFSKDKEHDKPPLPEIVIQRQKENLDLLKIIFSFARSFDNPKFEDPEFKLFVQIKFNLLDEVGDYKGLNRSIVLFRLAIDAKDYFIRIEEIEMLYRSKVQQDFYKEIFALLKEDLDKQEFEQKAHNKLEEILPDVKTEEGKQGLKAYVEVLDILMREEDIGLKLLYLFKKFQFSDFAILRNLSETILSLQDKNLQVINSFLPSVTQQKASFDKMATIIGMAPEQKNQNTYLLILQYLAMRRKFQEIYLQFQKLMELLIDWHKKYQLLLISRAEYPETEYLYPPELKEEVPGWALYSKYEEYVLRFLHKKN